MKHEEPGDNGVVDVDEPDREPGLNQAFRKPMLLYALRSGLVGFGNAQQDRERYCGCDHLHHGRALECSQPVADHRTR